MAIAQEEPAFSVDTKLQKQLRERMAAVAEKTGSLPVDEAVVRALPEGTTAQSSSLHGFSHTGFVTTKVCTTDADGKPVRFFVKYIAGQIGETMLKGEFEGMRAIEAFVPDLVPHAIATGQTTSLPKLLFPDPKHPVPIAFYVTEFLNLTPVMDLPPSRLVVEALGALQATSMTHPSNPVTFGFHMNTYNGRRLQPISPPRATWSELWATYMMNLYDQSAAANANDEWPEFATLMKRVCSHLVPRMLGPDILREPASRGGGPLRPALLHGDLWDGNVALNTDTGGLVMFDCSAMWGHQELDIVLLACPMREYSSTPILEEYLSVVEPSEPKDEFQDRRRLYNLKEFIGRTILYPGHISRQFAFDELFDLVEKYVPWGADDPERNFVARRHSQEDRDAILGKMVAAKHLV